jgi:hypothetical protein
VCVQLQTTEFGSKAKMARQVNKVDLQEDVRRSNLPGMKLGRSCMCVASWFLIFFFIFPVFQLGEDLNQKLKGISESITYGELLLLDFLFC